MTTRAELNGWQLTFNPNTPVGLPMSALNSYARFIVKKTLLWHCIDANMALGLLVTPLMLTTKSPTLFDRALCFQAEPFSSILLTRRDSPSDQSNF
eukprot:CAMPEP_0115363718 /NCGR_PEP_ID=MMETSP0270-20121206/103388_1 /TAXON_ID=71861 /ORGANISM="Scrippsiella trochoidea, Strain CCMP3099" /LENGTH=95 /DNA_ID=CAMNT_0002786375 /DNA_START=222 /DNA_END=506 /DNA_ORIENTATION=-